MSNVIERLEALAGTSTPRPWWTDADQPGVGSWPYQITTLEGGVVADNIENTGDVVLIVAAVNALPDLLKLAHAADAISLAAATSVDIEDWHIDDLRAALEPLFREAQP